MNLSFLKGLSSKIREEFKFIAKFYSHLYSDVGGNVPIFYLLKINWFSPDSKTSGKK
jgi:hypothetical protein